MATISERCWNANQSWRYEHTVRVGQTVLRISICRNAYDFQSWGKVERWDGAKWQQVVYKAIEFLRCSALSYAKPGATEADFSDDALDLEGEACAILGIGGE